MTVNLQVFRFATYKTWVKGRGQEPEDGRTHYYQLDHKRFLLLSFLLPELVGNCSASLPGLSK